MKRCDSPGKIADKIDAQLRKLGVKLTIGGEPSYVPVEPDGPEWSITALGRRSCATRTPWRGS